MALKLDILANTTKFVTEMKRAGASVEDVSDELDDMARDGLKAGDKLERSFRDMASELKDVDKAAAATGRGIGKNLDDGFDKAKRSADDFKQEANQTAKETAASFDGSAESVGDAFQEVAANAFAGFGPAGAAAGIAAAIGLGAITAAITANKEAAEEFKKNLSSMYQEAAEEGRTFLSESQIQAEATRLIFEDQNKLRKEAKAIGVDVTTLARAYAGSEEDARLAIEAGNEKLQERLGTLDLEGRAQAGKVQAVDDESRAIEQVNDNLETQLQWHKDNKQAAREVADLKKTGAAQERSDIEKAREADKRRADALRAEHSRPIQQKVVASVDDSAVRNHRWPVGYVTVKARIVREGSGWREINWQ